MSRKWAVARTTVGLLRMPDSDKGRHTTPGTVRAAQLTCTRHTLDHNLPASELRMLLEMLGLFRRGGEMETVNLDRTDYGKGTW